jgi:hypothetical protein
LASAHLSWEIAELDEKKAVIAVAKRIFERINIVL